MTIHRAHQIELIVNEKQELYLKKAVGCARFAFNWALNEWKQEYEAYKKDPSLPKPSQYSIRRKLLRHSDYVTISPQRICHIRQSDFVTGLTQRKCHIAFAHTCQDV